LKDQGNKLAGNKLDRYSWALFAEDDWALTNDFTLTGGLRMDDHEFYGKHWNPRAYAVYKLTDEITIKGGVAKAFRAPTLRE
ncbi:TonB-dependent receptor, partial [Klebsiella pneumoniae]|nr:TonB-dependent receptor [Klebsiella pneumoniae]